MVLTRGLLFSNLGRMNKLLNYLNNLSEEDGRPIFHLGLELRLAI